MSTADLLRSGLACALAYAVLQPGFARAHPVAQGGLDLAVFADRVSVRARPSMEEVLVAAALGGRTERSLSEKVRAHGDYLLRHLRVRADGSLLGGRVVQVSGEQSVRPEYELQYPLTGGAPATIVLEQDLLREFQYAPGNHWEAPYVARVERAGQVPLDGLLLSWREPLTLSCKWHGQAGCAPPQFGRAGVALQYVRHGVLHILSGYDHLLFIAALALAVATLWDLVKVISAFTLAHSITLTLSVLNIVRLPGNIVEPMIAASIVFVALQNVIVPKQSRGAGRLAVAFFFGLFHGLGFAGGLLSAMEGMAGFAVGLAIVAFSAGVEAGHQMVVLPIFGALRMLRRAAPRSARTSGRVMRYGSAIICMAGLFYLFAALR